jgi:hypothetical protein
MAALGRGGLTIEESNECKRRKIKCNGQAPCHRCGRQHIECVYVENTRRDSLGENEYENHPITYVYGRRSAF